MIATCKPASMPAIAHSSAAMPGAAKPRARGAGHGHGLARAAVAGSRLRAGRLPAQMMQLH